MASSLSLSDQVANAVILHEGSPPNELVLAPTGKSGYSVGLTQYDFGQAVSSQTGQPTPAGQAVINEFTGLLTATMSASGLTAAQINTIGNNIYVQGGSSAITSAMTQQIQAALSTPQGIAFTQSLDAQDLQTDTNAVESLISAANQNANPGAFANGNLNTQAVAELAAYVNVFGPSNPVLSQFLSTGTATLPSGQVVHSDGTLSLSDLNTNFLPYLKQYQDYPNQLTNLISTADQAATASSANQVDWDGTFSSPVQVVAANGTTTTTQTDSSGAIIATEQVAHLASGNGTSDTVSVAGQATETVSSSVGAYQSTIDTTTINGEMVTQTVDTQGGETVFLQYNTSNANTPAYTNSDGSVGINDSGVTVNLGAGATTDLSGSGFVVDTSSSNTINEAANTTVNVDCPFSTANLNGNDAYIADDDSGGTSGTISVFGDDDGVSSSGDTIKLSGSQSVDVNGNSDTVNDYTNDTVYLDGAGNTVNGQSGSGQSVDLLAMSAGSSATLNGSYQTVDLNGNGDTITTTGSNDAVNDTGSSDTVGGNGVTIGIDNASGGQSLTASGSGDLITDYGSNDSITGSGGTVKLSGSQTLNLTGNGDAVIDSTSDNVNLTGTGASIAGQSGDLLDLEAGSSATLSGNGNTINIVGNGASLTTSGSGDNVQDYDSAETVNGNSVTVNLDAAGGEQGLTTTGTGDAISDDGNANTVTGSNDTLTFSNGSETVYLNGSGEAINGQSGDITDLNANSSASFGSNNTGESIGLDASGDTVIINGSGNTVYDYGASDAVNGTSAVVIKLDGSGTLTAGDSSDVLTDYGSSDTVNGNGLQITLAGTNGQILDATGTGATVGENNSGDTVDASYDYIDTLGGSSAQNQMLITSGTGDQIGAANYDNVSVFGNNNTLTSYGSGNTANIAGTGDTVAGSTVTIGLDGSSSQSLNTTGTGDSIGENSSGDLINGSSETIYLSGGSSASQMQTLTVDGNDNATNAGKNDTLAVNGGYDYTTLGTGDTAFVSGNANQIKDDGYAETIGDKIVFNNTTLNTSQLQEVDPTSATSLVSYDYSATDAQGKLNETSYNYNSGTSAATFYTPSSNITIETEDYSSLNDAGNRTALTYTSTNGYTYDDSFVYSGGAEADYYQTVDNSSGTEVSEEEYNPSGGVVDDIYGTGSYSGYTPTPSGGYGIYGDDAVGAAAKTGFNISSISGGYHSDPHAATFMVAPSSSPKSPSAQTAPMVGAAQAASIDATAQARIASMIQAMASFGTISSSLQTSIQESLKELHEPVLAAASSSH